MTTLQLIYKIATSPEIDIVAINDQDDKTRMEAIEYISSINDSKVWNINMSLERGTMLIYE